MEKEKECKKTIREAIGKKGEQMAFGLAMMLGASWGDWTIERANEILDKDISVLEEYKKISDEIHETAKEKESSIIENLKGE